MKSNNYKSTTNTYFPLQIYLFNQAKQPVLFPARKINTTFSDADSNAWIHSEYIDAIKSSCNSSNV